MKKLCLLNTKIRSKQKCLLIHIIGYSVVTTNGCLHYHPGTDLRVGERSFRQGRTCPKGSKWASRNNLDFSGLNVFKINTVCQ